MADRDLLNQTTEKIALEVTKRTEEIVVRVLTDFAAYLTTRKPPLTVGSAYESTPILRVLQEYLESKGINPNQVGIMPLQTAGELWYNQTLPNLGLATTQQLFNEICARIEMAKYTEEPTKLDLNYKTYNA
jgi:hypothetical protein